MMIVVDVHVFVHELDVGVNVFVALAEHQADTTRHHEGSRPTADSEVFRQQWDCQQRTDERGDGEDAGFPRRCPAAGAHTRRTGC